MSSNSKYPIGYSSSDVYSSSEKRRQLAQYSISAWKEAPWAKHIREKSWASEEEIKEFQEELLRWEKRTGAFVSATWCEALGYVS